MTNGDSSLQLELNDRRHLQSLEDQFEVSLYNKRNLVVSHAKGSKIFDVDGTEYIDCTAGFGVANLGHSNPEVLDAIQQQISQIITCPEIFYSPIRTKLLKKLLEIVPNGLNQVFLCNSGTEANEAAIKFAKYSSGKSEFICFMKSFHGRTLGSLSATFQKKYRDPFQPLVPGFTFVPYNNLDAVKEAITENTAGIIVELVQGEGGVNPGDKDFITGLKDLCTQNNILLIVDEVQTGFGRTGEIFACRYYGITPDILTLAKSMANGVPIGATICNDKIKMQAGLHGSTFGGNSLACAASIATIDQINDPAFLSSIKQKAVYFTNALLTLNMPIIKDIRSLGFMFGIELRIRAQPYLEKLMDLRVIALPAGTTVIRLLPPLIIREKEIDFVIDALRTVLSEIE